MKLIMRFNVDLSGIKKNKTELRKHLAKARKKLREHARENGYKNIRIRTWNSPISLIKNDYVGFLFDLYGEKK